MTLSFDQQRIQCAETQITDLQKDNTRLVNETRMLRAQLKAARAVLIAALVDSPIELLKVQDNAVRRYTGSEHIRQTGRELATLGSMYTIYERIELLEKDAWTGCAALARQFVKEMGELIEKPQSVEDAMSLIYVIEEWRDKFKTLLTD